MAVVCCRPATVVNPLCQAESLNYCQVLCPNSTETDTHRLNTLTHMQTCPISFPLCFLLRHHGYSTLHHQEDALFSFSIKLLHPSALTSMSCVCVCWSLCVCVVTLLSQSENGDIGCYGESIAEQSGK